MTESPASEGPEPQAGPAAATPRPGPARSLAAVVLVIEAFVVLFAVLVAKDLTDVADRTVWLVGGGTAVACLAVAGLLRWRWGYVVGSVLQLGLIALGFVVPTMFFLGAVFLALWILALYLPRLAQERLRERRTDATR